LAPFHAIYGASSQGVTDADIQNRSRQRSRRRGPKKEQSMRAPHMSIVLMYDPPTINDRPVPVRRIRNAELTTEVGLTAIHDAKERAATLWMANPPAR
jgi:hypothetical protein